MLFKQEITSKKHSQFIEITDIVQKLIEKNNMKFGICYIYIPHTTAAVTINENADPSVQRDMLMELDKMVPLEDGYAHIEGNSAAHIKASLLGFNQTILVENGRLLLGTWQGVYFSEFDGPKTRTIYIKLVSE
ncbi:secondary thiamine-phosphate synthase enzyme YjbQ [Proteinivorax hydrogeniformans]|uniref:Secondary thiamine-phosphate synthase enzyme YjbQ n=1 Tax=Proteinivorax hydrogeniformans TaxID=1826727 RepID=A0AAU8HVP8_9FIRM